MTQEALKLALDALKNPNSGLVQHRGDWRSVQSIAITAIKEALAQTQEPIVGTKTWFEDGKVVTQHLTAKNIYKEQEQEPVAWVDPTTLHHLKIGLEGVHLVYETEMVNSLPLYDKPQFKNPKQCLERLIRIMGTFDLATGHADTFDELLDSLESELRDVLGRRRTQWGKND